jgi:uncharacterized repeat protein (TIGR03803 family)
MPRKLSQLVLLFTGLRRNFRTAFICVLFLSMVRTAVEAKGFRVLHAFAGGGDGRFPRAGMIRDSEGSLYGTTYYGGAFGYGTVFKLDKNGKESILHSFDGVDGQWPDGRLVLDKDGNLFGTTFVGGTPEGGSCTHGCGTVFELDKSGKERVLYAFTGGADGSNPDSGLVQDPQGNLYGTTASGGDLTACLNLGCGTVFKIDKTGKETVLHAFAGGADGDYPLGDLIIGQGGNLYGTTLSGGDDSCFGGCGVVFKIDPNASETILYAFVMGADGWAPFSGVVQDAAGILYGTTSVGGEPSACYENGGNGCGTVFKLDLEGNETVLYAFSSVSRGASPESGLFRDQQGVIYGTTALGGRSGCGVVFKLDTTGKETVLHNFDSDVGSPAGSLVGDATGKIYGVVSYNGSASCYATKGHGMVFEAR